MNGSIEIQSAVLSGSITPQQHLVGVLTGSNVDTLINQINGLERELADANSEIDELNNDIDNINAAFEEAGVDVGDTPSEEYGSLIDDAVSNGFSETFKGKTRFDYFYHNCTDMVASPLLPDENVTNMAYTFANCKSMEGTITVPLCGEYSRTFQNCEKIKKIIIVNNRGRIRPYAPYVFENCYEVEEIEVIGEPIDIMYGTNNGIFSGCKKLKKLPNMFFSETYTQTARPVGYGAFQGCESLVDLPEWSNVKFSNIHYMLYNAKSIITVPTLNITEMSKTDTIYSPFLGMTSLENISFIGEFYQNIDFRQSEKLTVESLMNIINALADLTGQTQKTLFIGSVNIEKLTQEQQNIAFSKNWQLR